MIDEVLKILGNRRLPKRQWTAGELASAIGCGKVAVYRALHGLRKEGRVTVAGRAPEDRRGPKAKLWEVT